MTYFGHLLQKFMEFTNTCLGVHIVEANKENTENKFA